MTYAKQHSTAQKVYFAHPYSSWERGANENANGLLRQYIPKEIDLREVTEEQVQFAQINYKNEKVPILLNQNIKNRLSKVNSLKI